MTVSHPVEVELKLALPQEQAATFLKLMARRRGVPVRQAMRTLYFDTSDFALSALGVALRVRRAGRRWLQTIKTEGERHGGLSQRAEFEMPVSRGNGQLVLAGQGCNPNEDLLFSRCPVQPERPVGPLPVSDPL